MPPTAPHRFCIRSGLAEDARRLAALATQVWLHTYATQGITADIANHVLDGLTPDKFAALLADERGQVLVAERDGGLVGLAVLRFGQSHQTSPAASVELQTLYVQAHFFGCGMGKALLMAAEAAARAKSGSALWLTVNAKNDRAIGFYAHQGYTRVGTNWFLLGAGRHENHVLIGSRL